MPFQQKVKGVSTVRELSMHILDLAQNGIAVGASHIFIEVEDDSKQDRLRIMVGDNGPGIPDDIVDTVADPFTTTRTTRKVGLGIPMMYEAARACDGDVEIETKKGEGTKITATFSMGHIDRAPLGDIASTIVALVAPNPDLRVEYRQIRDGVEFHFDTEEIKRQLDGVPINEIGVLDWISGYLENATSQVYID